jgi:hypothetical protein
MVKHLRCLEKEITEVHTGFWWENQRKGNHLENRRRRENNIKIDFEEVV